MDKNSKRDFILIFNQGFEEVVLPQIEGLREEINEIRDQMASKQDLAGLATKEDLAGLATKEELTNLREELTNLRSDVLTKMDAVYKEVKDMREEQDMHLTQHERINEQLDTLKSLPAITHELKK